MWRECAIKNTYASVFLIVFQSSSRRSTHKFAVQWSCAVDLWMCNARLEISPSLCCAKCPDECWRREMTSLWDPDNKIDLGSLSASLAWDVMMWALHAFIKAPLVVLSSASPLLLKCRTGSALSSFLSLGKLGAFGHVLYKQFLSTTAIIVF